MKTRVTAILLAFGVIVGCGREIPPSRSVSCQLVVAEHVALEERGDSVISFVSSVSVCPNGKYFAVTDARQGVIAIYSILSGGLVGFGRTGGSISDSLAVSNATSWVRGRYLTRVESQKILDTSAGDLRNYYSRSMFVDDSTLYAIGDVRAMFVPENSGNGPRSYISHRMFVQRLNPHFFTGPVSFPEENPPEATFARRGVILWDSHREDYVVCVANQSASQLGHYAAAPTLATFNFTGKRLADVAFIPKEYRRPGLGYNFLQPIAAIDSAGEMVATYLMSSSFYNVNTGKEFEIEALSGLNERYFSAASSSINLLSKRIPDTLSALIGASIRSVEASERGTFIFVIQYGSGDLSHWGAFEYSAKGELLREGSFPSKDILSNIRDISYHSPLKAFTCISVSREGKLLLTIVKWE